MKIKVFWTLVIHFSLIIHLIKCDNLKQLYLSPSTSNLSCYTCSTIEDIRCKVINETYYYYRKSYSTYNTREVGSECRSEQRFCAVQLLEVKIDPTSSDYKFWAIERKCMKDCVNGCFVMGERTKLSLCTTCCTTNFCNVGDTSDPLICCNFFLLKFLIILSIVCNQMFSK